MPDEGDHHRNIAFVQMAEISQKAFEAFFRPSVRVLLNWERSLKECWPIAVSVVSEKNKSERFFAPWYISSSGTETSYADMNAQAYHLSVRRRSLARLRVERQTAIGVFCEFFRKAQKPVQLLVPAYALRGKDYLILDGNHRLAALLVLRVPYRVMLISVQGPLDPNVLPDLVHWEARGR